MKKIILVAVLVFSLCGCSLIKGTSYRQDPTTNESVITTPAKNIEKILGKKSGELPQGKITGSLQYIDNDATIEIRLGIAKIEPIVVPEATPVTTTTLPE